MVEITEDILAPLVRYLRADPILQELQTLVPEMGYNPVLGPPFKEHINGELLPYNGPSSPWIFRGFAQDGTVSANVEGTGSCAITLEQTTPWSRKIQGLSLEFVTIEVFYSCDPTRDEAIGAPLLYDARSKCLTLHKRVSRLLHMTARGKEGFTFWGARPDGTSALKVVTSYEGRGLNMTPIYNGDGMVEGRATFEMEVLL